MATNKDTRTVATNRANTVKEIYGVKEKLVSEYDKIAANVKSSIDNINSMLSSQTNTNILGYYRDVDVSNIYSKLHNAKEHTKDANIKKYMERMGDITGMNAVMSQAPANILYRNYDTIYTTIPQAARALDIIADNIISPDDFTKDILDLDYDIQDMEKKTQVEKNLKTLNTKYFLNKKIKESVKRALRRGIDRLAVLSLNNEITRLMDLKNLNESGEILLSESQCNNLTKSISESSEILNTASKVNPSDIIIPESFMSLLESAKSQIKHKIENNKTFSKSGANLLESSFMEAVESNRENKWTENILESVKSYVADKINTNIVIKDKNELIVDNITAIRTLTEQQRQTSMRSSDIPNGFKKISSSNVDINLTGSVIKELDINTTVELKIDDLTYGYFYSVKSPANNYFGMDGRNTILAPSIGDIPDSVTRGNGYMNSLMGIELSSDRNKVMNDLFVTNVASKLNKTFIKDNPEFKEFIYELLKDKYITDKQIGIMYLFPEEVVSFETEPVYKKVLFYSKLYIGTLVNDYLIKMGKSHDKRVYYLDMGLDGQYEQVVMETLQSIKTSEYKLDDTDEINTVININPGRFDDFYIPTVNGERIIDIETISGMNSDEDNEFRNDLLESILSGIGVSRTLVDTVEQNDFARTLSAQNSNLVRNIISRQDDLTPAACKLYRSLYNNEYNLNKNNKKAGSLQVDISKIKANFPSPATLALDNTIAQMNAATDKANMIVAIKLGDSPEPKTAQKFREKIIRDSLPMIDWDKMDRFLEEASIESTDDAIDENIKEKGTGTNDPNSGMFN